MTSASATPPSSLPQYSPDGQWWWTGTEWVSATAGGEASNQAHSNYATYTQVPAYGYPTGPFSAGSNPYQNSNPYQSPNLYPNPNPYQSQYPGQYPGPNYYQNPGQNQTTNGLSTASLVLGIVWITGLGSLLAIIFGHIAHRQIKENGQRGRGMATAGLILGYLGLTAAIAIAVVASVVGDKAVQSVRQTANVRSDLHNAAELEDAYYTVNSTYTNDISQLSSAGLITLSKGDSLLVGVNDETGYCIIGTYATGSSHTWSLYDSQNGGLQYITYHSLSAAEADCSDPAINDFEPLVGGDPMSSAT